MIYFQCQNKINIQIKGKHAELRADTQVCPYNNNWGKIIGVRE